MLLSKHSYPLITSILRPDVLPSSLKKWHKNEREKGIPFYFSSMNSLGIASC